MNRENALKTIFIMLGKISHEKFCDLDNTDDETLTMYAELLQRTQYRVD